MNSCNFMYWTQRIEVKFGGRKGPNTCYVYSEESCKWPTIDRKTSVINKTILELRN